MGGCLLVGVSEKKEGVRGVRLPNLRSPVTRDFERKEMRVSTGMFGLGFSNVENEKYAEIYRKGFKCGLGPRPTNQFSGVCAAQYSF
ncbi:hypothetical protein Hanom_Chr07g00619841 [Helianthus anomalus]